MLTFVFFFNYHIIYNGSLGWSIAEKLIIMIKDLNALRGYNVFVLKSCINSYEPCTLIISSRFRTFQLVDHN